MDPLLISAAGLIAFAMLMVAIAWRRWTATAQSLARVEALHALVAESAATTSVPESALGAPRAQSAPAASETASALAAPSPTAAPDDDWDFRLRDRNLDDLRPAAAAASVVEVARANVPAASSRVVAAAANRFVVTVPDASAANASQLSFQRTESRP